MYRLVNVRFSRMANVKFQEGELVATRMIRRGQPIRVPEPKKIQRSLEEEREIERLAEMSYQHALGQ